MRLLRDGFGTFCDDPGEVEARSLLAFCMAIGTHFLTVDHPGRTRAEVSMRASDLLFDRSFGGAGRAEES